MSASRSPDAQHALGRQATYFASSQPAVPGLFSEFRDLLVASRQRLARCLLWLRSIIHMYELTRRLAVALTWSYTSVGGQVASVPPPGNACVARRQLHIRWHLQCTQAMLAATSSRALHS